MWRQLALVVSGAIVSAKREDVGYFWHVTDFHYDPHYGKGLPSSVSTKEGYDMGCWTETRGRFGDYNCDAPATLIKSATAFLRTFDGTKYNLPNVDPDLIFWTGDDTAHADNSYFNESIVLDAMEFIMQQLSSTGLYVLPVLGNHDTHQKSQMPVTPEYYTKFANLLTKHFPNIDQTITNQIKDYDGFFYVDQPQASNSAAIRNLNLRIIGLNSNLWSNQNKLTETLEDPAGQFRRLEETLQNCRESSAKALIFSHIPPGKFERYYGRADYYSTSGFHWLRENFNKKYLEIIESYSDVIEIQLLAHHHTDSFRVFRSSEEGLPLNIGLIAPGVTPWNSTLAPETGANNPALRLFEYNATSGSIVDYHQFYLNLTKANYIGRADWELEYSFKSYFNASDMTPASLLSLVDEFDRVGTEFDRYYAINTVSYEIAADAASNCDLKCRSYHKCAMKELDYEDFDACVENHAARWSPALAALFAIVFLYTST